MGDIDQIVLHLSSDDFESPATIVEQVAHELRREVTVGEVLDAYRRLVGKGLVTAYRFDDVASMSKADLSPELRAGDKLWFLAVKGQ